MAKLKVYRTPIGFHDAFVAAPSQKAALKAWGSDADLFARGIAEIITDEALIAEPLASPGTVIRKLRGTADEQLEAAKMPDRPKVKVAVEDDNDAARAVRKRVNGRQATKANGRPPSPPPRPNGAALDAAREAVKDAAVRHDQKDRDLRKRQEALDQERRQLDKEYDEEQRRLAKDEERAHRAYDKAMAVWQEKN